MSWKPLHPDAVIDEPCLLRSFPVAALTSDGRADEEVLAALELRTRQKRRRRQATPLEVSGEAMTRRAVSIWVPIAVAAIGTIGCSNSLDDGRGPRLDGGRDDGGAEVPDGGRPEIDAGSSEVDAAMPLVDAFVPPDTGPPAPSCAWVWLDRGGPAFQPHACRPGAGVVDGMLVDPQAFFTELVAGRDPDTWQSVMNEIEGELWSCGVGQQRSSGGEVRGRLFLPTAACPDASPPPGDTTAMFLGVRQEPACWDHPADVVECP